MTINPFDTDSAATEAPATESTTSTKKENTLTTTESQSKIVTTLKGGSGYDAPWVVVHSDTPAEALDTLSDPALKELLDKAKEVGAHFSGGSKGNARPKQAGQPQGAVNAPAGSPNPPEGYVFKSGISKKNGKPWKAFMPIDRNSGLETIWL